MHMNSSNNLSAGRSYPMGSQVRDRGVNFAVFSDHAERIELCLFDADGVQESKRYTLFGPEHGVFHGFLEGASAGLVYGLRAYGRHDPQAGHRFNPHKLLLDPNAREIVGRLLWAGEHYGYCAGHPDGANSIDLRDNATSALKARVAAPCDLAPGNLNAPRHATSELVLYEVHVKGFSKMHPGIPDALQGTYAGLAHPASIAHFKSLGVTTLSLLPVHYHLDEPALAARGQTNYWAYNTLGFCCPDPRLASQPDDPTAVTAEFRAMVASLHAHGLEVVLDVVYNHTPEGDEWGPTLSFRGLDNASWYRLAGSDRSRFENISGCGNTLNIAHPRVTQFVLDSLRYWVQEMGVDGFRFDLAPVLGRGAHGFDACAPFFAALRQDPCLARVHLIAEPWDGGVNGYQVGRFPGRFLDWNDKFRDALRGYWLRSGVDRGEMARRLTASSDLFQHDQRRPSASVNFLSVHDGLTLTDVVSYSRKHNLANGEDNRDGRDSELCANFGVEGATDDAHILRLRGRLRRAMMASLLLAQGTPMLCAGDEIGNTQQGNNNAYCQDNPVGWLDWSKPDLDFKDFVARLLALRRREPCLGTDEWSPAPPSQGGAVQRHWRLPNAGELDTADWHDPSQGALACELRGGVDVSTPTPGHRLLLIFNPQADAVLFALDGAAWELVVDSSGELPDSQALKNSVLAPAHAVLVLRGPLVDPLIRNPS